MDVKWFRMHKVIVFLLAISALATASTAARVDVEINERTEGDFVFTNYTVKNGVINATTEFYNLGSNAYSVRMRLEIYGQEKTSVWTDERKLHPGNRQKFSLFAVQPEGNFSARLRAYYGNEIVSQDLTDFYGARTAAGGAFEISNAATFDDRIEFDLKANADVHAMLSPVKYPDSWIFEQADAGYMANQTVKRVAMRYKAGVWSPESVVVSAFSEDGGYYTEARVQLSEPQRTPDLYTLLISALRLQLLWANFA